MSFKRGSLWYSWAMQIDQNPRDWQSDRPKPREPIFGPGWPYAVGTIVGIVGAAFAIQYGLGAGWSWTAGIVGAVIGKAIADVIQ